MMDQDKSLIAESILNITLEIIYLLTGEDYIILKKTCGDSDHASGRWIRPQSTIATPPPQSLTFAINSEKILELTDKIIELLTREVPARQILEESNDVYEDGIENYEPFSSLDEVGERNKQQSSSSTFNSDYTGEAQSDPQDLEGEESVHIKIEIVEGEENESHSRGDVQCKEEEIPIGITADSAHTIRGSSLDWEVEDNNKLNNSPEDNYSFQNKYSGLQGVTINNEISDELNFDKLTFPLYGIAHNGNIFTCMDCDKCFTQYDALLIHQNTHGEKLYPCPSCGKCFKKKSNLIQHQKIHTGEKPFLCSECGKSFTRKADLIKHQRIHTGEKPFPCPECGKCFTQISTLTRHRRYHSAEGHRIKNTLEDQLILSTNCKIEDKPVSEIVDRENPSFANVHRVLQDADINSDVPGRKSGSVDQFDFAICSVAPKSDKIFSCLECDKMFTLYAKLMIHQRSHIGEKPFLCSYCRKRFTEKSNLIQHEKIHLGEKRFICSVCGKCFTRKADLIKHFRIHTGEKPFHCLECGKCFTQTSALLRHKKFHTGEKPFACSVCGKCFTHRPDLNKHLKIHNREKSDPQVTWTNYGICVAQK